MSLLSVIVPCYNEQEALPFFYDAIVKVSAEMKNTWGDLEFE
jgi:glycosyltransferase involved in cell wall biosynthesis